MALANLISRVEAAAGPHADLCPPLVKALGLTGRHGDDLQQAWALTDSLDAVLALVAEKLPGWAVDVSRYAKGNGGATLWRDEHDDFNGSAATPALALLAALLRALDAAPSRDAAGGGDA